jgi:hypothetical protein
MHTPRLRAVTPIQGRMALTITWENGRRQQVDLSQHIRVFPPLNGLDDLEQFGKAAMGNQGLGVHWPGGQQVTATTLFRLARMQSQ